MMSANGVDTTVDPTAQLFADYVRLVSTNQVCPTRPPTIQISHTTRPPIITGLPRQQRAQAVQPEQPRAAHHLPAAYRSRDCRSGCFREDEQHQVESQPPGPLALVGAQGIDPWRVHRRPARNHQRPLGSAGFRQAAAERYVLSSTDTHTLARRASHSLTLPLAIFT